MLFLIGITGCDDGTGHEVRVSGRVIVGGQPIKNLVIWFIADKSGSGFQANIQSDGQYMLTLLDVKPGDSFQIAIAEPDTPGAGAKLDSAGIPVVEGTRILSKYYDASTSGLTATIESTEPQTFDFTLTPR